MGFITGLLTFVLLLDCLVLVFLVLIQLPKKEAGAGLAFGGAATDALFGAGSGTVLTKVTKYSASIFFVLAIFLAILQSRRSGISDFERRLQQPGKAPIAETAPAPGPAATAPSPAVTPTNLLSVPAAEETNVPVTPAPTNTAAPAEAK